MNDQVINFLDPVSRFFMALIFVMSGIGKIGAYAGTQSYMEAYGLPGMLLAPTIIFEIGVGIFVLVGFKTKIVASLSVGFCLLTAVVFHSNFADQTQQIMFLKNVAMAGGFLMLVRHGSGLYGIDAYQSPK